MKGPLRPVIYLAVAAFCVFAYHAVGEQFYGGFHVPQGLGMEYLLPQELAQAALFALFGSATVLALAAALLATRVPERALDLARRIGPGGTGVAAAVALGGALLVGRLLLAGEPICDDENTYRFIARTLEQGAVVAPSPGGDLAFYREQFVVLTEQVRYGKYTIGHPALLTLGRLAGAEWLVVPLLVAALVLATARLGRRLFGPATATLGAVLLAISPQLFTTGGTWLSQPAAAVCLCLALVCLLAMGDERRRPGRAVLWAAGAGLALGYGVLVRPLPGVLFVAVALGHVALEQRPRSLRDLRPLAALVAPLAAVAAFMVVVNRRQTGDVLVWAYQTAHERVPILNLVTGTLAVRVSALAGNLIRLDHWFLGWPLALLFALAARRHAGSRLLWGVVGAELLYRLLSPKVGVGTVGPLYLFEALPALALLTADGMVQVATGRRWANLLPAAQRVVPALLLAGSFVAVMMFLPPRLGDLAMAGAAHQAPARLLAARHVDRALVFYEAIVPPEAGLSWAYEPRNNGPRMDDDVLFVNFWRERPEENLHFWRRRHPDRPAFYFGHERGQPLLMELDQYVAQLNKPKND